MQLKWPMLWDLFSLFPAHAGVIPLDSWHYGDNYAFPRTRGGDPHSLMPPLIGFAFSPHTRG